MSPWPEISRTLRILSLCMLMASWQIQAASAADVAHGRDLAQRWCAACHAVATAPQPMTDMPPSFLSIAQRPDFDANRLAYFLLDPHPKMPNMGLSRNEAMDLAAYIASLRN